MTLWSLDIETMRWSDFALGIARSEHGESVKLRWRRQSDLWDFYSRLSPHDTIIGHNAGRFDFLALIDSNPGAGWRGTLAGSALVSLRAVGGAECRDSYRVFPLSLAALTGGKTDTGLRCRCSEDCGGYCAIDEDLTQSQQRRLFEYCENDAALLLGAWSRGIARLEDEGFEVRGPRGIRHTIGSIAFATAIKMCDLDPNGLDWGEYDRGLDAYYGGRNEAPGVWAESGHRFDMNQAYPWALTLPVPTGEPQYLNRADAARRAFVRGKPGVYTAVVDVPGDVALLPSRSPRGRLLWCTGRLEGSWTGLELAGAIERGAKLREIKRAMVYPREAPLYEPYMRHVWRCRETAKAEHNAAALAARRDPADKKFWSWGKAWVTVTKFAGNAPSGKLAQSPGVERLVVGALPHPDERKGDWSRLSQNAYTVTVRPAPPKCARPVHAATLTGRVHLQMLDAILSAPDDWLYSDTDSWYGRVKLPDDVCGGGLGAFKYEGPLTPSEGRRRDLILQAAREAYGEDADLPDGLAWLCHGPKLYAYRDERGEYVVRMKGFPLISETRAGAGKSNMGTFAGALAGEDIPLDRGVYGVRQAFRTKGRAFARREMTRALRADGRIAGTRLRVEDGRTVPLHRHADGSYGWRVEGAPDPEEILKLSVKPRREVAA